MTKHTRQGIFARALVALSIVAAALGCSDGGGDSSHVVTAKLVSIDVAPATTSVAVGATQQFTATGKYDDNSTKDLTATAAWSSGAPATATISAAGLATGVAVGTTTITAASGGKSGTATLSVKQGTLTAIVVSPASPSIAVGGTQPFTAEAQYDDGSKKDVTSTATWASGTPATATISTAGLATGVAAGTTAITATSGGVTGSAALTVTGTATLQSITVTAATPTIAANTSTQLTATGSYSDGSKKDLSATATWTSGTTTVATVSATGLAKGVAGGTSTITAASGGVMGTLTLMVTPAKLVSIAVTPGTQSIAAGTSQPFTATGTFDDSTTQDLTATATWTSGTAATATISAAGVAKALATGTSTITASVTAGGATVSGTATLTVTAALLKSLAITPAAPSVAAGTTAKLTATGTFGDDTTQDLTTQVTWTSGTPATATVSGTAPTIGVATAIAKGSTVITAKLGTIMGSVTLAVTDAQLVSISVTPSPTAPPRIAKNTNIQLVATGVFTDGSKQDLTATASWDTSKATVATVSSANASAGLVSGLLAGPVDISATVTIGTGATATKISGKLGLTVTDAKLVSLAVTPDPATIAAGFTQQYVATGIFNDASTQDLTATVTWKSDKAAFATISNAAGSRGLAKGVAEGAAQISATIGAITDAATLNVTKATLQSIAITPPAPSLALGTKISLVATGTMSDQTTVDLTKIVNWTSTTAAVATISNAAGTNGQVTTVAKGTSVIKATDGALSATVTLTVTDVQLVSLQVTATKLTIEKGTTVQFTATGIYTDQSKQDVTKMATWKTDKATVATISNATASIGLATAVGTGQAVVTATIGAISDTATLTVDDGKLVSIEVKPAAPTIAAGTKVQLIAIGTFDDGAPQDITSQVTWSSDNAAATISNADDKALATGVSAGAANIMAKDPTTGVSGTTKLTVTGTKLKTIVVTTSPVDGVTSIAKGMSLQYLATGFFEDASKQDLTDSVTWASSAAATASISNAPASNGLAVGLVVGGPVNITASLGTVVSAAVPLTVSPKALMSIVVTPATPSVPKGGTVQLVATGTYSDGTTQVLTADAALTWTSAAATTAKVSNAAGQHGLVTGAALGMTDISATSKGVTGKVTVTVTAPVVATIAVTPAAPTITLGHTQQFVAMATLTDGTKQDISATATWASSAPTKATISTAGLATSVAAGTTKITATSNGVVSNTVTLTIN